ncbi:hypothetical protein HMPREF9622_02267 [Cutibacterium modestum HL037PA3]|nr:hypothetical protein HMPREF9622_02267 [Cutibacterium modestum HL037PA3]
MDLLWTNPLLVVVAGLVPGLTTKCGAFTTKAPRSGWGGIR